MADFSGTMRIAGDGGPPVPVTARVGESRLVLETGGVMLGEWPVASLSAGLNQGGVVLRLGTDEVTIDVTNRTAFVAALAPAQTPARRRRRPPLRLVLSVLVALGLVAAAVLAPQMVGSVALLLGLILLLVGTAAYSEPRVAVRLPASLQAVHFIVAGMLVVGIGVVLVLFS